VHRRLERFETPFREASQPQPDGDGSRLHREPYRCERPKWEMLRTANLKRGERRQSDDANDRDYESQIPKLSGQHYWILIEER
jgi:hypothetical protein